MKGKTRPLSAALPLAFACVILTDAGAAAPDNWRKVRGEALKKVRSDNAAVRETAFEAFRDQDHVEAAELLIKTINSPNTPIQVRRHARDILATFRAEESREVLYRMVRSNPGRNHLLLEAFAGMEDERGPEVGGLAIKKGSTDKRAGAPIIAGGIRCLVSSGSLSDGAIDSIIERTVVGHPIAVRKAATDAMFKLRKPQTVQRLVDLTDDPAMARRARLLLVCIAGEDQGIEKASWQVWWDGKSDTLPETQDLDEVAAQRVIDAAQEARVAAGLEPPPNEVSFYGVPIEGQNVVFVLDASSSMRGYQLERLQSETRRMVEQLPEDHKFALVFFPKNEAFPPELSFADEKTKERAYKFIDKRVVIRGTPTGDAMKFAYRRFVTGQDVDAIYLLSDGQPTKPIDEVLDIIDNLNLGQYVAINTIFIGETKKPDPDAPEGEDEDEPMEDPNAPPIGPIKTGADFLKEVARRHQGTFTIVEVIEEPN